MDLHSDHPFWAVKKGLLETYPPITGDVRCEVLIIGAGITGALVAATFVKAGIDCVIVDRRDAGRGSTSASTALLQYEIDKPLHELIAIRGKDAAERAYRMGLESIDELEQMAEGQAAFHRRPSLQVTRAKRDVPALRREFEARKRAGLPVTWLERQALRRDYGIERDAAIRSSRNAAAECDPYSLTDVLLKRATRNGARIFDRTEVRDYRTSRSGIVARTDRGPVIRAGRIVFASGFETQEFLPADIVKLVSTYAFASEPVGLKAPWKDRALIWETGDSYLYCRTCPDGRVLVGGEDDGVLNPQRRDAQLPAKTARLVAKFDRLMPSLGRLEPAFQWAGTFGTTRDGLAYIGSYAPYPRCYFALGFGGNGITFSMLAARMLRNQILSVPDPDAELFRFGR